MNLDLFITAILKLSKILVLLEIIFILVLSQSNAFAQTYNTITKQKEMFKNNPQIPVGTGGFHSDSVQLMAVNPTANKIYVPNPESNTVSVIDSNKGNVTNIRVGIHPIAITFYDLANKLYVANSGSNSISVIDGSTDQKEPHDIPVGRSPDFITGYRATFVGYNATSSSIDKLYVANSGSNSISVIATNASTNDRKISEIPVGIGPRSIALGHSKIYVANYFSNTVSVINASNDRKISEIPVQMYFTSVVAGPSTGFKDKIYLTHGGEVNIAKPGHKAKHKL